MRTDDVEGECSDDGMRWTFVSPPSLLTGELCGDATYTFSYSESEMTSLCTSMTREAPPFSASLFMQCF
jgi:hypothetical protein